jgi:transcriptional regulator with GAF, ATPase, and Fis domain
VLLVAVSSSRSAAPTIIGGSPGLRRVLDQVDRLAPTAESVLIQGESGTGKEGIAHRIHARSGRRGPLVVVNCAALPAELAESELFGHVRGAFTGAVAERVGLIAAADGGTLFLDEVGELPLEVQAKLLRVLQEREIRPLGGRRVERVDVRFVAATLRDLEARVAQGLFRDDLLFRLSTFTLVLPPLRERGDDVLRLARHFVAEMAQRPGVGSRTLARSTGAALRGHAWPGNVRELQAALLRAAVFGDGKIITGADIRRALEAPTEVEALEDRLMNLLESAGELSMGAITTSLRVPRTTAWRALGRLSEQGRVCCHGQGRGRRYAAAASDGRGAVRMKPSSRRQAALELARAEGRVTRQLLVEAAGVSERTAGRILAEMVAAGALIAQGRGRGAGYRLSGGM